MIPIFPLLLFLWLQPGYEFERADAQVLVKNTSRLIDLPANCPLFDETQWSDDEHILLLMVYNKCHKGTGNGLVGPYYVNLKTGDVRFGNPDADPEDSPRLRQVKEALKKKNAKTPKPK